MSDALHFQVVDLTCRTASVCLLGNLLQVSIFKQSHCFKITNDMSWNHKISQKIERWAYLNVLYGQFTVQNKLPHIFISSVYKNLYAQGKIGYLNLVVPVPRIAKFGLMYHVHDRNKTDTQIFHTNYFTLGAVPVTPKNPETASP